MDLLTKDNGLTTKSMATVHICGKMGANSTVSGSQMTCRAMVYTSMLMACATTANTSRTRKKASVSTIGLMAANTKAGGTKESSTVSAPTSTTRKGRLSMDCGKVASE